MIDQPIGTIIPAHEGEAALVICGDEGEVITVEHQRIIAWRLQGSTELVFLNWQVSPSTGCLIFVRSGPDLSFESRLAQQFLTEEEACDFAKQYFLDPHL